MNWLQKFVEPSELFTNTVPTPAACARAAIAAMLPLSDWLRYQIHIPWSANAVAAAGVEFAGGEGFGAGGCSAWLTIWIGPKAFE